MNILLKGEKMDMTAMLIILLAGGFFVLVFAGIGIFMLVKYFRDKGRAEESKAWPATAGEITQAYIRESQTRDSDGYMTTSYYPEVRYLYDARGVAYTGEQISFGGAIGGSHQKAAEIVAQYPVGKNLTVYYNPNNPAEAVIERRIGSKLFLIIGAIFTVIGVCTACVGGSIALITLLG